MSPRAAILTLLLIAGCAMTEVPVAPPRQPAPPLAFPADDIPTLAAKQEKVRIPILMYHRIAEPPEHATEGQLRYIVTPEAFRAQLAWLRDEGYEIISLAQFERIVKGEPTVTPAKTVVLTFDDGYRDNLATALPILQEFHAPATFFVYLWAVEKHPRDGDRGFMSWDELKLLVDAGMDIGSHSMSHGFLAKMEPKVIRWEVRESRRLLQENLGVTANYFSYPYSSVSDAVRTELRDAGFALGLKALGGPDHRLGEHFLDIPRIEAAPDLPTFQARVRWEQWAAPPRPGAENAPTSILESPNESASK